LNENRHVALNMGKGRDFLAETLLQMKYSAKGGKTEMGLRQRLGWVVDRSERGNMKWQMGDQWNDSKGRKAR